MAQYELVGKEKVEGKAHYFKLRHAANGDIETFKVFEGKIDLINNLESWEGRLIDIVINGEWLNSAVLFTAQETVPTKEEVEKKNLNSFVSQEKITSTTGSPLDKDLLNAAIELVKAEMDVQARIAISEAIANKSLTVGCSDRVDMDRVYGIYIALKSWR